jgi:Na+/H+ antiporter NhaD/arsenite permease-like protein
LRVIGACLSQGEDDPEVGLKRLIISLTVVRVLLSRPSTSRNHEALPNRFSLWQFLKYGLLVTVGSLLVATAYIWLRYLL